MKKTVVAAAHALLLLVIAGCSKVDAPPPLPSPAAPDLEIRQLKQAATFLAGGAIADSTIYTEGAVINANYGSDAYICVGHHFQGCDVDTGGQVTDGIRRAVINFGLPPTPAGLAIFGGTMTLATGATPAAPRAFNISAYQLSEAFTEGTVGTGFGESDQHGPCGHHGSFVSPSAVFQSGSVSWNSRGPGAWASGGGGSITGAGVPSTTSTWDISTMLRNWYLGAPQFGILIVADNEGTQAQTNVKIPSRENATVANRPSISVEFRNAGGTGCSSTNDCGFGLTCVGNICCHQATCDDGSLCTADSCGGAGGNCVHTTTVTCTAQDQCHDVGVCAAATGVCSNPVHVGSCNDGLFCNGADTCNAGACTTHAGSPCTTNTTDANCSTQCNEAADACNAPDPNGTGCNDGTFCNGTDTCNGGVCNVHTGNPCTINPTDGNCATSCNEAGAACNGPDPNGTGCNDGAFCNGADTCTGGACSTHTGDPCPVNTTDANCSTSCNETSDACNAPDPNGTGCSDGTFCNGADTCNAGACATHAGSPCPVNTTDANCSTSCNEAGAACNAPDPNGSGCNDGTFCNGADTCSAGACTTHGGNPCTVNPADGNCSTSCNEAGDACNGADPNGTGCNDGTFCNGTDTCNAGTCSTHTGNPCPANTTDANCSTSCNEAGAACNGADPNGTGCNDGTFCNGNDTCTGGACATHSGNPCPVNTTDANCSTSCNEAGDACNSPDPNGTGCNDGTFCNGADTCTGGACATHAGNPCPVNTTDANCSTTCNEAGAACNGADPNGTGCNDGTFCNGADTCTGGACATHAGNPCPVNTTDANCSTTCNEAGDACNSPDPNGTGCNDGTFCNGADTCNAGACATHAGNPCPVNTTDANCSTSCNEAGGACNAADLNGTGCNDGTFCNGADTCNAGACATHAGNPCPVNTTDANCSTSCNEAGDACNAADPNGSGCNDANSCTAGESCQGGACIGGTPTVCTASDQCHDPGVCNTGTGVCSNPVKAGTPGCNDGNSCTNGETCQAGVCTGGVPKVCTALDQCHDPGVCNTSTGACTNPVKAGTPACTDGLTCNIGEKCQAGVCTGGGPLDCSASATDDCHAGQCTEPGGCFSQPLTGNPCDDGSACTNGTTCNAGTCGGGTTISCDDGDPCTTDSCNPGSGCLHTGAPDGTPCAADANACTRDTCLGGLCHRPAPVGTLCGAAPSCTGAPPSAVATPPGACDGTTTTCQQAPIACGSQPCNGTTCLGSCTADAQCSGTQFCDLVTGQCKAKVGVGASCLRTAMCNGLTCVDTVCCSTACAGGTTDCQTCNGTSPGTCTPLANNASCDDGVFCNGADTCTAGACTVHPGNPCPGADGDGNCAESCNEAADACNLADPNGSACNDGLFCNVNETCQVGLCQGGTAANCSVFSDTCNTGVCNEAASACQAQPIAGSIPCNADNSLCTSGDQCLSGLCTAGPALNCNDGNACTTDSCAAATGCGHVNLTGPACLVDGNPCTLDTCVAGVCNTPVTNGTQCGPAASCAGSIPNAVATPAGACTGGSCVQTPVPCGPTTPCNGAACQGGCTADVQCPTGFFCNTAVGGQCQPAKTPGGSCTRDQMCQSGTTCVDTVCCTTTCGGGVATDCVTCNGTQPGTCTNQTGTPCDDGAFCTGADTCNAGACTTHAGSPCPGADGDGNCKESCNEATDTCDANDPAGSTCDDGLFCTVAEKCNAGVCGSGTPRDCSASGDQCNTASCDETNDVCKKTPLTGNTCVDTSSCTNDEKCQAGVCVGTTNCDDGNPCTDDSCSASACVHTANTANCEDGNACTSGDKCNNKVCVAGPPTVCDDGKPCTDDSCDTVTGCKAVNDNTNTCSDNDGCTTGDHCVTGACVPTGGKSCDDANPCTDDTCNISGACVNTANTAACEDGNACTSGDKCNNKVCVPGSATVCDDGKQCTDDSCDPTTGCKAVNDDTNPCTDGNACTNLDHCAAGVCTGTALSCNDSNPCTDDSCDTTLGCQHANNTLSCDDGNACTTPDTCAGGNCTGGPAITCDDGKPCTVDKCVPATGCVFTAGNVGLPCRSAIGVCDDQETCNGTSPNCPADVFDTGRACSPPSCTLGQGTPAGICNGASTACPSVTPVSCGAYVCNGTACRTTCATANDCAQGNFCDATGHCNDKVQNGDPCTSGGQCASTFCVDGVCCNGDCSGQCEACNLTATRGTCTPVSGIPVGSRPACPGTDPTCKGTCNGSDPLACSVPNGSVQCKAASCNAATNEVTPASFCNAGSCPVSAPASCGQSICVGTKCSGCATDVQCPTGDFCDLSAGLCKPLLPPGGGCTRNRECGTGQCVDNVCCNTDCTGQCETCKDPAHVGTCVPVTGAPIGRKPCSGAPGLCAGTCDGTDTRSCVYAGPGTVCTPASCSGSRATAVAFCDGAGSCPPDKEVDCALGCFGDVCDGDCSSCQLGQNCVAGVCVGQKEPGDPCSSGSECASSFCADGVCCLSACTGQCEACNLPNGGGICTPVTGAPKGSRQACSSDGTVCGGVCDGTNRTGCFYEGATRPCRPANCTSGVATLGSSCQGNGSCGPLQLQDCSPNACASTICANGCTSDTDCAATEFCSGGVCVPKLGGGTPCAASTQCATNHCVDGLCCDKSCTGQCEACDQATQLGTCVGVSGAPRQGRPACAGSGACGGFCSPANPTSCTVPTGNTACGVASCQNGYAASTPFCAAAVCVTPVPSACDPYACAASGDGCATTCVDVVDCARGLECVDGFCQPPSLPDGGTDAGSAGGRGPDASVGLGGSGPDAGAGGTAGTAGAAGAAGAVTNTGGTGNAGGGAGGSRAQDAGLDSSIDAGLVNGQDRGSCGCRTPTHSANDDEGTLVALAAAALLALRRRRRDSIWF